LPLVSNAEKFNLGLLNQHFLFPAGAGDSVGQKEKADFKGFNPSCSGGDNG
jgi:hypothetical protein